MRSTKLANSMFAWAFLLGLSALAVPGCAAPIDATTGSIVSDTFESAAADETFDILVRLPPGYEGGARRYPVVYQLDATFLDEFARSAGTLSQLSAQGVIDEPIVVGIGHRGDQGPQRNRFVDFVPADPQDPSRTGRAAEFYHFLHDELAPRIETTYRTDPAVGRAIVGHSLGGLMALYSFCQRETDGSPAFRNVLAADPSYGTNDGVIFAIEAALAATTRSRPGRLFLTASVYTGGEQKFAHEEMTRRIGQDFPDLTFRSTYEETTHGGILQISMDEGLPFVMGGAK